MKLSALSFLFPLLLSVSGSYANSPNQALHLIDAIHILEKSGYNIIQKIKYEKNSIEATILTKQGNKQILKMNLNGEILNQPKVTSNVSLEDAITALNKAGYKNIQSLESKKSFYKANALDAQGKKHMLKISFDNASVDSLLQSQK